MQAVLSVAILALKCFSSNEGARTQQAYFSEEMSTNSVHAKRKVEVAREFIEHIGVDENIESQSTSVATRRRSLKSKRRPRRIDGKEQKESQSAQSRRRAHPQKQAGFSAPIPVNTTELAVNTIVALRGGNDNLYCSDEGPQVRCNQREIGEMEKFAIIDAGSGKIALRGRRGYCSDEQGVGILSRHLFETLKCDRRVVNTQERFMVSQESGRIALKGVKHNGYCYVSRRRIRESRGSLVKCDGRSLSQQGALFQVERLPDQVNLVTIDRIAVDMAKLADASYNQSTTMLHLHTGTYHLRVGIKNSASFFTRKFDDFLALYATEDNSTCVLAASGTNDNFDWLENINFIPKTFCEIKGVHTGFAGEVEDFFKHPKYQEMKETLQNRCRTTYLTGHSLGGAIASIIAGCAAKRDSNTPFEVHGLYTIGAPGVSREPIANGNSCFKGLRVYNYDKDLIDPVPYVTSRANLVGISLLHPRVQALQIENGHEYGGLRTQVDDCNSPEARDYPKGFKGKDLKGGNKIHAPADVAYVRRMEELCFDCK